MQRILVTGGTGTIGSGVVARLRDAGHAVRVLSRREHADGAGVEFVRGDLATGAGVDAAVAGAEVVVHCAGSASGDEAKTRQLIQAAARAGTRHIVSISVVGADRIPVVSGVDRAMFGYFAAKLAAERVVEASGIPWTTLRATQVHELIWLVAEQLTRLPVVPLPAGFRFQPIAAAEVSARLAELALGAPAGVVPELAGPRVYSLAELLRGYLRATRRRRPMLPLWMAGRAARAIRAGANLAPERAVGQLTWEAFVAARAQPAGDSRAHLA